MKILIRSLFKLLFGTMFAKKTTTKKPKKIKIKNGGLAYKFFTIF